MMEPVLPARPARLFASLDMLPGDRPARHFRRALRVADVVDDENVADIALHLGRDVGVALVHVEAMHANAAGLVMHDLLWLGGIRYVPDLEAAVVIAALGFHLDFLDVGLSDTHTRCKFGSARLAAEAFSQLAAKS